MHDLVETLLEGSPNAFVHKDFLNLGGDIVLTSSLGHSHVSPINS